MIDVGEYSMSGLLSYHTESYYIEHNGGEVITYSKEVLTQRVFHSNSWPVEFFSAFKHWYFLEDMQILFLVVDMFYIVSFTGILLLMAICICVPSLKRKACVYFVIDVQVNQFFGKSIYDQHTCPRPRQEAISSTPEILTPAALSFENEMQISVLWEFRTRSHKRQRTEKDALQTNRSLCWEQQAQLEVPHIDSFHWHITASGVLWGPVVHCGLEILKIYSGVQSAWDSSFLTVGFCACPLTNMIIGQS